MSEPTISSRRGAFDRYGSTSPASRPEGLADILERVLDKGIIIAGDIRVNLLDIELLTIKIRLLIVSVDKAMEMGIDWWRHDPMLSTDAQALADENRKLRERVEELERDGE
ncbi:gas vesicle protein GvpA/GvpJ/GvpM family [Kribbella sp. VKM Ac-2571]|uniref:gas vesicle protein n=1 Tax=Kribbella sp. VKM Ac-2571 TaxID=2512222 RepID=UPI001061B585|nr:gas vesicle protein [Kribbella sp. VKM Ac-2571]TDO66536.1 gas vesicle protein GvpA/GvpJ/GvpM family [Kribbella sp. VKM Ac-2571]